VASAHRYTWTAGGRKREAWRAKWQGPDGQPRSKRGFDRKGDALAYAQDQETASRHGLVLDDMPTTVEQWASTWQAGLRVREETAASYDYALERIKAAFGPRPLTSLRPSEIRAWRQAMRRIDGKPLADSTADKVLAVLATMLRAAVHDGLLEKSPMPPGRALHRAGRVVDPAELLTLRQVRAWGAKLPLYLTELPLIAASTGLRQGEMLGLRLPNVDFLRRQVHVVEQLRTPKTAGSPAWGPTKTPAGVRTVPLPTAAAEALARHLERQPPVDGEPVFRGVRGQRWRANVFQKAVLAGRVAAELPGWATWHSLRDVYASSLIRQGVDVRTVMTLLGHVSAEETLRTYGRLWGDATDTARSRLDDLWDAPDYGDDEGSESG
jgi:integrase